MDNTFLVVLWSHVEISLAILATSLVALRPLLRQFSGLTSIGRSKESSDHQERRSMELTTIQHQSGSGVKMFNRTGGPRVNHDGSSQDLIIED